MRTHPLIWFARVGFIGWLLFELLNLVKILHFTLDFSWLGLMLTGGFIWAAIEISSRRLLLSVGQGLPWVVYIVGLFGTSWDALGDIAHFYNQFDWYDQVAHFNGGMTPALIFFFIFTLLVRRGKLSIGPKLLAFFAVASANVLGILYEIEEYLEDVFFHTNRLGDGPDTANDLMLNLIGSVIAVLIASYYVYRLRIRTEKSP